MDYIRFAAFAQLVQSGVQTGTVPALGDNECPCCKTGMNVGGDVFVSAYYDDKGGRWAGHSVRCPHCGSLFLSNGPQNNLWVREKRNAKDIFVHARIEMA